MTCLVMVQAATSDRRPQKIEQVSSTAAPQNQQGLDAKDERQYLPPNRTSEASKEENHQSGEKILSDAREANNQEQEIRRQPEQQHIYNDPNFFNQVPPHLIEPINEEPPVYFPGYQQPWAPIPNPHEVPTYFSPPGQFVNQNLGPALPVVLPGDHVHATPELQLVHVIPHQYHDHDPYSNIFEVQGDPLHSIGHELIPHEHFPHYSPHHEEEIKINHKVKNYRHKSKKPKEQDENEQDENEEDENEQEENEQDENEQQRPLRKKESNVKYILHYNDQKHGSEYQKFVLKREKENRARNVESSSGSRHKGKTQRRPSSSGNKPGRRWGSEKSPITRHYWKR